MSSITLNVPDELRSYLEARAKETQRGSAEAYVESLIVADRERAEAADRAALEAKLLEGLNSGPAIDATSDEYWDRKRAELTARAKAGVRA